MMKFADYCERRSAILGPSGRNAAHSAMLVEAKRAFLRRHVRQLYARADPAVLWQLLLKHRACTAPASSDDDVVDASWVGDVQSVRVTFEGFRAAVYELLWGDDEAAPFISNGNVATVLDSPERRRDIFFEHPFLSPRTFLAFEPDASSGTIPVLPLYTFIAKRLLLLRLRVELELAATQPPPIRARYPLSQHHIPVISAGSATSPLSNSLSCEDLENFIASLIPNLRLVRDMPPWLLPYYLCHSSRKFFMLLDAKAIGAVSIDSVMKSEVFSELLRLYESDPQDATVPFPQGCVIEVPRRRCLPVTCEDEPEAASTCNLHAEGAEDEEELVTARVDHYEGDGNCLSDKYRITLVTPNEPSEATSSFVVRRAHCYWCPQTTPWLPADALLLDNWFSLPLMYRVYTHFTQLDVDGDGVLTEAEFLRYSGGSYTPLAVHRVFECYIAQPPLPAAADDPQSEAAATAAAMDFKNYLNFVVATEHPHTLAAVRYLWRLLDIEDTRDFVSVAALRCFSRDVSRMLVVSGLLSEQHVISSNSILTEVIDMVNPAWHEHVTLHDLESCGQQATVLLILLNYKSFFAYDRREQSAAESREAFVGS